VITTSADLAAQQINDEQASALIHGLGEGTAAGVTVGGAEGVLLALNDAAVTTNQVLNEDTIPDSPKHYTDANGNEFSPDQIDAILATAGITTTPEPAAPETIPTPAIVVQEPTAQQVVIETAPQPVTPIVTTPATQD